MDKLKIGLDYHGVINRQPAYFSLFTDEALRRGHEIHIITGGPRDVVEKLLQKDNIRYSCIFAILDYYDAKGIVEYFDNGEFKIPDKLWDSAKAEYCSLNGINMHIDDSRSYVRWFTTPYCHYDAEKQNCRTENSDRIDFTKPPAQVLDDIEKIISSVQYY